MAMNKLGWLVAGLIGFAFFTQYAVNEGYVESLPIPMGDFLSVVILAVSGALVVWYTIVAERANEIQERPVLQFEYDDKTIPGSSRNGEFYLKNIGKGAAYNISIEKMDMKEGTEEYTYQFYLEHPNLEVADRKYLKMWVAKHPNATEFSKESRFLFRLVPNSWDSALHNRLRRETPAIFIANYTGLNGKRYHSIFHFYCLLPSVGDMAMQFIKYGEGERTFEEVRSLVLEARVIPHPGSLAQRSITPAPVPDEAGA